MVFVQKWPFFHVFGSKKGKFSQLFFSGNIGQQNVFYDILERKNAFLGYKKRKFKKSKNGHFCKGVNPWFCSKNGDFSFFGGGGNIDQQNVFYDILEQKNAFLGYQNMKFKLSKMAIFPNGLTHGLCPKMAIFPFFFRQYRPGKCLLRYSRMTKTPF